MCGDLESAVYSHGLSRRQQVDVSFVSIRCCSYLRSGCGCGRHWKITRVNISKLTSSLGHHLYYVHTEVKTFFVRACVSIARVCNAAGDCMARMLVLTNRLLFNPSERASCYTSGISV